MFTAFTDATARFMKNGPARLFAQGGIARRLLERVASAQTAAVATRPIICLLALSLAINGLAFVPAPAFA